MAFSAFLDIRGVPTNVACWGSWVEEGEPDEVIICLPGNPGLVGFYFPYLENLHRNTGLPVWTLSHAGHDEQPGNDGPKYIRLVAGNKEKFDLLGQYKSKLEFIKRFTKPTTKIHLVGHSIGAWMVVELLKDADVGPRIATANLLFPTLQKMASTPNGIFLTSVVRRCVLLIWALLWLVAALPASVQVLLVKMFMTVAGIPRLPVFVNTARRYVCRSVVEKVLFMAFDELDKVRVLDLETLRLNSHRVNIIYGDRDGWAPKVLFERLRWDIPGMYCRNVRYQHAFCLTAYQEVANHTAMLILQNKN